MMARIFPARARRGLCVLLLLLSCPRPLRAADLERLWQQAHAAYDAGDYPRATAAYRQILRVRPDAGWVLFNLGNSLLRDGDLGPAVAAYRQSAARLPRQADVQANLAYARQRGLDAASVPETAAVWRRIFFWHFGMNSSELLVLTGLSNLLFWGLLAWRRLRRVGEAVRLGSWVAGAALLALGASTLLRRLHPEQVAVVVPAEIEVYSGTDRATVVRFRLHAGTEMWVRDVHEGWVRVQLGDDKEGWVAATDVVRVEL